jgi:hypothetical protein
VANHNEPKLASLVSLVRSSFAVDAACTFALGRLVGNVFATAVGTQLINTRFPTARIWQTRLAMLWSVRQKIARPFTCSLAFECAPMKCSG